MRHAWLFSFIGLALLAQPAPPKAAALGKKMAADLEREYPLLQAPPANDWLIATGERLANQAQVTLPAPARLLKNEAIRAVTFPGGFIYLSAGLVRRTASEAELTGVIAHLIAHAKMLPQEELVYRQGAIPILFVGDINGMCTRWSNHQLLVPRSQAPTLRSREREADQLAANLLRAAGDDPLPMLEFFNKLRYEFPRLSPTLAGEDLLTLRATLEDELPPAAGYRLDSTEFADVQAAVAAAMPPKLAPPILQRQAGR